MSYMDRSRRRDHRGYDGELNGGGLPVDGNAYYPRYYPQWFWGPEKMAQNPPEDAQYYTIEGDPNRRELGQGYYAGGQVYDNVGYMGHQAVRGYSYKLKQPSSQISGESYHPDDHYQRARSRRCCVVLSVVGLVFLLAAGIGIGIYFGVVDKPESMDDGTPAPPVTAVVVDMQLTMEDEVFDADLDDPNSEKFKTLKQQVEAEVDQRMAGTPLASSYIDSDCYAFSSGSVKVYLKMRFSGQVFVNENSETVALTHVNVKFEIETEIRRSGSNIFNVNKVIVNAASAISISLLGETCSSSRDCINHDAICLGLPPKCSCASDKYDSNDDKVSGVCLPKLAYDAPGCNDAAKQCLYSNSQCINGRCLCGADSFVYESTCLPFLPYGGVGCLADLDSCSTTDSVCVSGVCGCSEDSFYESGGDICLSKIALGQTCTATEQCLFNSAACLDGECSCLNTTYANYTTLTCDLKKFNGQACDGQFQCLITGAVCTEVCTCPDETYLEDTACLAMVEYGETCLSSTQCLTTDSSCTDELCLCDDTYYHDSDSDICIPKSGYNGQCTESVQCLTTNSTCLNSKCICESDFFYMVDDDECVMKYENGGACTADNECLVTGAECDSTCECPWNKYLNDAGTQCEDRIDNGFQCSSATQCLYQFATCDGLCACPETTYAFSATKTCKDNKIFGDDCTGDEECPIDASCSGQTCSCSSDKYENSDRCSTRKENQVVCNRVEECLFTGAECNVVCRCPSSTYENETSCETKIEYGGPCTAANQCETLHSVCDGTCSCNDNQFFNVDRCKDKLGDGESCNSNDECSYDNSVCLSNECTCPDDRFVNNSTISCELKKDIGEQCISAGECLTENAVCMDSLCSCSNTTYEEDEACVDKKFIGGLCSADIECSVTDSVCADSACACRDGTYLDESTCEAMKGLDEDCNADIECLFDRAVCDGFNVCACPNTTYSNGEACVNKLPFNSQCTMPEQCSTTGSDCMDSRCSCGGLEFFEQGTNSCQDKLENGFNCASTSQCLITNAVCDTTCKCLSTNYEDQIAGSCEPKLGHEETCTTTEQCSTKNSSCTESKCQCADDFFFELTNNACSLKLDINAPCSAQGQCLYTDAGCTAGLCKCPETTYVDTVTRSCLARKNFGDVCTTADQCPFDGICVDGQTICGCPSDWFQNGDRCTLKKDNQVDCNSADECLFTGAECSTVCQCPDTTYIEDTSCIDLVEFDGDCTEDYQCETLNSECSLQTQTCSCADTKFFNTDRCSDKLGDGEACNSTDECSYDNAVCLSEECTCPDDRFVNNAQLSCDLKVINNVQCTDNSQCLYGGAVCDNTCQCPDNKYLNSETCEDKKPNDASCSADIECAVIDATCDDVCKCFDSAYLDGDQCYDKLEQGDNCTSSEQCRVNQAICNDVYFCACDDSMYEDNDACVDKILNGESCTDDEQCLIINATCADVCGCASTQFIEDNTCKDQRPNGEYCESDSYCLYDNAACISEECDCPAGLLLDGTACQSLIALGGPCEDETWCSTTSALCSGTPATCKCNFDHYYDGETDTCTSKLAFGSSGCVDSVLQCMTSDAVCSDIGICTCDEDYFYFHGQCLPKKPIGQLCSDVAECNTPGSVCDVSCKCPDGWYDAGTECSLKVDFGEDCTVDKQCKTINGKCLTNCSCLSTYIHDSNTDECVIKKAYNASCSNVVNECITENAECNTETSTCLCPTGTYFSDTKCRPLKAINASCSSTVQCETEGSVCNSICTCPAGTYYDVSCLPQVNNGQQCTDDMHCLYDGAGCYGNSCDCPENTHESGTSCVADFQFNELCEADMECGTGLCIQNICGCLETHFYDETAIECSQKIGYDGQCESSDQCETQYAECSTTCTCPSDRFLFEGVCFEKLGDGEACSTNDECTFADSVCNNQQCTCPGDRYANNDDETCDLKKPNGALCSGAHQCNMTNAECDFLCQCPETMYESDAECMPKKYNGFACEATEECLIPDSECNTQCQCPSAMFLHNMACVQRLGFGEVCAEDGDCNEMFICANLTCSCEQDYDYIIDNTTCIYAPPTTPVPTTDVPDEDIEIVVDGQLISDTEYNVELNDQNSTTYQQLVNETSEALRTGFSNQSSVSSVDIDTISPGSVVFHISVSMNRGEVTAELSITATTPEELEQGLNLMTSSISQIAGVGFNAVANILTSSGILGNVVAPDESIEIAQDPCLDDNEYINIIRTGLCSHIYSDMLSANQNKKRRCRGYIDLLTCLVATYQMNGLDCEWNKLRLNLESLAIETLGFSKQEVKKCVKNNWFSFDPLGGPLNTDNPCADYTILELTAIYQCTGYVEMIRDGDDVCYNTLQVVECSANIVVQLYGQMNEQCTVNNVLNSGVLTFFMDYQQDIFEMTSMNNCEFCLAPNIYTVWKKHCGYTLSLMTSDDLDAACGYLHLEIMCIETHIRSWEKDDCGIAELKDLFKSDPRFLREANMYIDVSEEDFMQCLDMETLTLGPLAPEDYCVDQNVLRYALETGQCYENLDESCTSMYSMGICIQDRLLYMGLECDLQTVLDNTLRNDPSYTMTLSSYISQDGLWNTCWESAQTEDGICMTQYMEQQNQIMASCSSEIDGSLAAIILGSQDFSCVLLSQLTQCAMDYLPENCKPSYIQPTIGNGMAKMAWETIHVPVDLSVCPVLDDSSDQCTDEHGALAVLHCLNTLPRGLITNSQGCGPYVSLRRCVLKYFGNTKECGVTEAIHVVRSTMPVIEPFVPSIKPSCLASYDDDTVCPHVEPMEECKHRTSQCSSHKECNNGGTCCYDGCKYTCIDLAPHEGVCPAATEECEDTQLSEPCTEDYQCAQNEKCCSSECGSFCTSSVEPKSCEYLNLEVVLICLPRHFLPWQTCGMVYSLVSCLEVTIVNCTVNEIIQGLDDLDDTVMNMMTDGSLSMKDYTILHSLAAVDREYCEEHGFVDKYPCTNKELVQTVWDTICRHKVDIVLVGQVDPSKENFGVSPKMCRHYFELVDCIALEMRKYQAQCNPREEMYEDIVYASFRTFALSLPEDRGTSGIECPANVCSYIFYFESAYSVCGSDWMRETFHRSMYGTTPEESCLDSPDIQQGFKDYMICIQLLLVTEGDPECTLSRYMEIMYTDPLPIYFPMGTDVTQCLPAGFFSQMDAVTYNTVCESPLIVSHFHRTFCIFDIGGSCSTDMGRLNDPYKCLSYFQNVGCIQNVAQFVTGFPCEADQVSSAIDEEFRYNAAEVKDHCTDNFDEGCMYPVLRSIDKVRACWDPLHQLTTLLSDGDDPDVGPNPTTDCGLLKVAGDCVTEYLESELYIDLCDNWNGMDVVKDMLGLDVSTYIQRHDDQKPNCSITGDTVSGYIDYLHGYLSDCQADMEFNLCEDRLALTYLTVFSCPASSYNRDSDEYQHEAAMCFDYVHIEECGMKATYTVRNGCTQEQVRAALIEYEVVIKDTYHVEPSVCTQENSCFKSDAVEAIDNCIPESILWHGYSFEDPCRAYSFMWTCVSNHLQDICGPSAADVTDLVNGRIDALKRKNFMFYFDLFSGCYGQGQDLDVCDRSINLAFIPILHCWQEVENVNKLGCESSEEAITCVFNVMISYTSVRCPDETRSLAKRAIIQASFRVEMFFVSFCLGDKERGNCPARSAYEFPCYGYRDLCIEDGDCDGGLKCCHDGHAAACTIPAQEPATFMVWINLHEVTYTEAFSNSQSEEYRELMEEYEPLMDVLFANMNAEFQKFSDDGPSVVYYVEEYYNPENDINRNYNNMEVYEEFSIGTIEFVEQEIDESDRCPVSDENINLIVECIRMNFTDENLSSYTDYQTCERMRGLAECVKHSCWRDDKDEVMCEDVEHFIDMHSDEVLRKLQLLVVGDHFFQIRLSIDAFNADYCRDNYDQDPCWDDLLLKHTMQKHSDMLASFASNELPSQDSCRTLFGFIDIVTIELKAKGSRWCNSYTVSYKVMQFIRDMSEDSSTDGPAEAWGDGVETTESHIDVVGQCKDYIPVCSYSGMVSRLGQCGYPDEYDGSMFCRNDTARKDVQDFVKCMIIQSIIKEEVCHFEDVLDIITSDRYRFDYLDQKENISNCFTEDEQNGIEASLSSLDSLCTSHMAVESFRDSCSDDDCDIMPGKLDDPRTSCVLFLQQISCVQREMKNQSLYCELEQLSSMALDIRSPLHLGQEYYDQCLALFEIPQFTNCELPLLSRINGSMECVLQLHGDPSTSVNTCGLVSLASSCLFEAASRVDSQCDPSDMITIVKDIKLASEAALTQIECKEYTAPANDIFDGCDGQELANICDPSTDAEAKPVMDLTAVRCPHILKNMTRPSSLHEDMGVDSLTFLCSQIDSVAKCGDEALDTLHQSCPVNSIRNTVVNFGHLLPDYVPSDRFSECLSDECQFNLIDRTQECFATGLHWYMYGSDDKHQVCRMLSLLWECVKSVDVMDNCDDNVVTSHVNLELYYYGIPPAWDSCIGDTSTYDICMDYDVARYAASGCYNKLYNIESADCMTADEAVDCVEESIGIFGECGREYAVGILKSMARQQYIQIDDLCFNVSREGYCPLQYSMSSCRDCGHEGRMKDNCLIDSSCVDGAKCCHDGCRYTCLHTSLAEPARFAVRIVLLAEPWDETFYNDYNGTLLALYNKYRTKAVSDFYSHYVPTPYLENVWNDGDGHTTAATLIIFSYMNLNTINDGSLQAMSDEEVKLEYKYGANQVFPPKDGDCPAYGPASDDWSANCCEDYDCSGSLKCCHIGHESKCSETNPVNMELSFIASDLEFLEAYSQLNDSTTEEFIADLNENIFGPLSGALSISFDISGIEEYIDPSTLESWVLIKVLVWSPYGLEDRIWLEMRNMPDINIVLNSVSVIGELLSCDDTNLLLSTVTPCGINLLTIQSDLETCSDVYGTLSCMSDQINAQRPRYSECSIGELRESVTSVAAQSSIDISSISLCAEIRVIFTVYSESCNMSADYESDSEDMAAGIMSTAFNTSEADYIFQEVTCSDRTMKINYRVLSAIGYDSIESWVNEAKYAIGDDRFSLNIWQLDDFGIDRCDDIDLIKGFAEACARQVAKERHFERWEYCSPANEVRDCVQDKIKVMPFKRDEMCHVNIFDNGMRASILEFLNEQLSGESMYAHVLMSLTDFSEEKCLYGDIYPCYNEMLKSRSYNECIVELNMTNLYFNYDGEGNFSASKENCRMFNSLMDCVGIKLRGEGARCDFYGAGNYVERMLLVNHTQVTECYALQSVCSVKYLASTGHNQCYSEYRVLEDFFNLSSCRTDKHKNVYSGLFSCLAIQALKNNETECTPTRIFEVARSDPFNADIFSNTLNVSSCISADDLTALDSDLDSQNICTSKHVINHITHRWSPHLPCNLTNVADDDINAACSYQISEMIKLQFEVESMLNKTCDLVAMVNMELSTSDQSLSMPQSYRDQCAAKVINAGCTTRELYIKFNETRECMMPLYNVSGSMQNAVCGVRPYILTCLKNIAKKYCVEDEVDDDSVSSVFLDMVKRPDVHSALQECTQYMTNADNLPCLDAAVPTGGNQCSDDDFIGNVTLLSCGGRFAESLNHNTSETAMCFKYWELVECGVNVTGVMNIESFNGTDPRNGCPKGRVNAALTMKENAIRMMSNNSTFSPLQCQDQCSRNINEALEYCVAPIKKIWSDYEWKHSCIAYTYMYQCVDRFFQKTGADCQSDQIHETVALGGFRVGDRCGRVEGKPQLSMCANFTDVSNVIPHCAEKFFNEYHMGNQSNSNTTMLDQCINETVTRWSYRPCSASELLHNIPRALGIIYVQYYSHIPGVIGFIKQSHGITDNEGHCPYQTQDQWISTFNCIFDADCESDVGKDKCCLLGQTLTCASPSTEKAQFNLKVATELSWMYSYGDMSLPATEAFVKNLTNKMSPAFVAVGNGTEFWIHTLHERFSNKTGMSYVDFEMNVWSFVDPGKRLPGYFNMYNFTIFDVEFYYEDTPGICPIHTEYCDDGYIYGCNNDYECRASTNSPTAKCCYGCGNKCIMADTDLCDNDFETAWYNCDGHVDLEDLAPAFNDYGSWDEKSCRAFEELISCVDGKMDIMDCEEEFVRDRAFNKLMSYFFNQNTTHMSTVHPSLECDVIPEDECRDINVLYYESKDHCMYYASDIFNERPTSVEKCRSFTEFSGCVYDTLTESGIYCNEMEVESTLKESLYLYFERYRRDFDVESSWYTLDVYECEDNDCLNVTEIEMAVYSEECTQFYDAIIISEEGMSPEVCGHFSDLTDCVVEQLGKYHFCNYTMVSDVIGDFLSDHHRQKRSSHLVFDSSYCQDLVCTPRSLSRLASTDCYPPFNAYMTKGHCRHLGNFIKCVKSRAMSNGETCPMKKIYHDINVWWNQTGNHEFLRSPEYRNQTFELCPVVCSGGTSFEDVETTWNIHPDDDIAKFVVSTPPLSEGDALGFSFKDSASKDNLDAYIILYDKGQYSMNFVNIPDEDQNAGSLQPYLGTFSIDIDVKHYITLELPLTGEDAISLTDVKYVHIVTGSLDSDDLLTLESWTISQEEFNFTCENDPAQALNNGFPLTITAEDVCENDVSINYWLQYECMESLPLSGLNKTDLCFLEYFATGCVYDVLKDLGCTFSQISATIRHPEARVYALGPYNETCVADLGFTACHLHILYYGKLTLDVCYSSLSSTIYMQTLGSNISSLQTVDGQSLVCSIFEDAIGCLKSRTPNVDLATGNNMVCDDQAYWKVGSGMTSVLVKALNQTLTQTGLIGTNVSSVHPVSFDNCTRPSELTYEECPTGITLVEIIVATCRIGIEFYYNEYYAVQPCSIGEYIFSCVNSSVIPTRLMNCDRPWDSIVDAMTTEVSYLERNMFGYNSLECDGYAQCSQRLNMVYSCFRTIYDLSMLNVRSQELCGILPAVKQEMYDCLKEQAEDCDSFIPGHIDNVIKHFNLSTDCPDGTGNLCNSSHLIAHRNCFQQYSYFESPCTMYECVQKALPTECDADSAQVARDAYYRFYGYSLGPCTDIKLNYIIEFGLWNETYSEINSEALAERYHPFFNFLFFDYLDWNYTFIRIASMHERRKRQVNGTQSDGVLYVVETVNKENPKDEIMYALYDLEYMHRGNFSVESVALKEGADEICIENFMKIGVCTNDLMDLPLSLLNTTEICGLTGFIGDYVSECLKREIPICEDFTDQYGREIAHTLISNATNNGNCTDGNPCAALDVIGLFNCHSSIGMDACETRQCFIEALLDYGCPGDLNTVATRSVERFMNMELPPCYIVTEYKATILARNESFREEYWNLSAAVTQQIINAYKTNVFDPALFEYSGAINYTIAKLSPYNGTNSTMDTRFKRQAPTASGLFFHLRIWSSFLYENRLREALATYPDIHLIDFSTVTRCTPNNCKNGYCDDDRCVCPDTCTADYDPICAMNRQTYQNRTFSNSCDFDRVNCPKEQYIYTYKGECEECTENNCPNGYCDNDVCRCLTICTEEYAPVCAMDLDTYEYETFSNMCYLRSTNCPDQQYKHVYDGECEGNMDCTEKLTNASICYHAVYNLYMQNVSHSDLCGALPVVKQDMYACLMKHADECESYIPDHVRGAFGYFNLSTNCSECEDECEWYKVCADGTCVCPQICAEIYDPVCHYNNTTGVTTEFSSECHLKAEHCDDGLLSSDYTYGSCDASPDMSDNQASPDMSDCLMKHADECKSYIPDHVQGAFGYFNLSTDCHECEGECEWYKVCADGTCVCPQICAEIYDPVCHYNNTTGVTTEFSSECHLKAEHCDDGLLSSDYTYGSCDGDTDCTEKLTNASICYHTVYGLNMQNVSHSDFCGVLPGVEQDMSDCLMKHADECKSYIPDHVQGAFGYFNLSTDCHECEDECEWYEVCADGTCVCPQLCAEIYDPVCHYNNTTGVTTEFSSECHLMAEHCDDGLLSSDYTYGSCDGDDADPEGEEDAV